MLCCAVQHMAISRRVLNPMEKADVVGITNYVDIGGRMWWGMWGRMVCLARWSGRCMGAMVGAVVGAVVSAVVGTAEAPWTDPDSAL